MFLLSLHSEHCQRRLPVPADSLHLVARHFPVLAVHLHFCFLSHSLLPHSVLRLVDSLQPLSLFLLPVCFLHFLLPLLEVLYSHLKQPHIIMHILSSFSHNRLLIKEFYILYIVSSFCFLAIFMLFNYYPCPFFVIFSIFSSKK